MAKYQQYEEYKDSEVEWLGDIPSYWEINRHKYVASFTKGKNPQEIFDEYSPDYYPYLSMDSLRGNSAYKYAPLAKNLYLVNENQPLIIWDGSNAGEFVRGRRGILSSTMAAAKLNCMMNPNYYWYLCMCIEPEMRKHANGMGIPHVNGDELKNISLVNPSLSEQSKIANFLDHETAQIDTLIEKQQTLIQLLKEKRQAVISHAVTKGLKPDAPMKDSGVEWLGKVPEHWDVMQFRRITSLSQGLQIPQSERIHEPSKNNVEYITIKSIHAGDTLEHREYINKPSLRVQCDYDDVLLARTGATGEVITGVKGAFHNNFFKIDYSEKIDKNFLVNMLKVQELRSHLLMLAGTTTIPDLNHGAFLSTAIALPSLEEQEEICSEISRLSEKYNLLLEVAIKQVKLLQERRTALISAAVTGKIDVRSWVAPE